MNDTTERPAVEGEYCTCGREAVLVFEGGPWGPTGYCGVSDGGRGGPCPWCGSESEHIGRCPEYRLTGVNAHTMSTSLV